MEVVGLECYLFPDEPYSIDPCSSPPVRRRRLLLWWSRNRRGGTWPCPVNLPRRLSHGGISLEELTEQRRR